MNSIKVMNDFNIMSTCTHNYIHPDGAFTEYNDKNNIIYEKYTPSYSHPWRYNTF